MPPPTPFCKSTAAAKDANMPGYARMRTQASSGALVLVGDKFVALYLIFDTFAPLMRIMAS